MGMGLRIPDVLREERVQRVAEKRENERAHVRVWKGGEKGGGGGMHAKERATREGAKAKEEKDDVAET